MKEIKEKKMSKDNQKLIETNKAIGIQFNKEQIDLLKRTVAKGTTDDELSLFMHVCKKSGLDPFSRQIYAVKRWSTKENKEVMTIQTGIDGYRLTAERTGCYCPGKESIFNYDKDNKLISATAYVKKLAGGLWHEISATAFYEEYVQLDKNGNPNNFWSKMKHTMLVKCFDNQTKILTEDGFVSFPEALERDLKILQVTERGLEAVKAIPFSQKYDGDMVVLDSDDLNFSVTPNHDMITTIGKIEASEIYAKAAARSKFWIPRSVSTSKPETKWNDIDLYLCGVFVADGTYSSSNLFSIEVSRERKVKSLLKVGGYIKHTIRKCSGDRAFGSTRIIVTKKDKQRFTYSVEKIKKLVNPNGKQININELLKLSARQSKIFVDAWIEFDGHLLKDTCVRRLYSSRKEHIKAFQIAAICAGYSIGIVKSRQPDIGKINYHLSISDRNEITFKRWGKSNWNSTNNIRNRTGLTIEKNKSGIVWCVKVPSGKIVVQRNGFSMVCGNCAEAGALRKAFPAELSGIYTFEEMQQTEIVEDTEIKSIEIETPKLLIEDEVKKESKPEVFESRFIMDAITMKTGITNKKEWKLYTIYGSDGAFFKTFSNTIAEQAIKLKGYPVIAKQIRNSKGEIEITELLEDGLITAALK